MKRIVVLFFLSISLGGIGQTNLFNRSEIGLKLKPSKKFTLSLSGQYRWNVSEKIYSKSLFSTRMKFDVLKPLSVIASYRRTWMPNEYFYIDNEVNTYGHRFAVGLSWDIIQTIKPKAKSSLKYTTQYQKEYFKFKREQIFWRNRFSLDLYVGLKRLQPSIAVESFFRTNQYFQLVNGTAVTTGLMNEMRYSFSLNFNLPKNHEVQLGTFYRDYQTNKWDAWVLQVAYFYTLEKKKEKTPSTIGVPEF